jgi:hypothetical protein
MPESAAIREIFTTSERAESPEGIWANVDVASAKEVVPPHRPLSLRRKSRSHNRYTLLQDSHHRLAPQCPLGRSRRRSNVMAVECGCRTAHRAAGGYVQAGLGPDSALVPSEALYGWLSAVGEIERVGLNGNGFYHAKLMATGRHVDSDENDINYY